MVVLTITSDYVYDVANVATDDDDDDDDDV